jgi:hypothetical protein
MNDSVSRRSSPIAITATAMLINVMRMVEVYERRDRRGLHRGQRVSQTTAAL